MQKFKKCAVLIFVLFITLSFSGLAFAESPQKINLNSAPLEELVNLNNIGPKYAQRIIDYRETVGPFELPEDIMKVKGIGTRTYENNKDVIVVK